MKRIITADVVEAAFEAGERRLAAPRGRSVITPGAWSRARELGVTFDESAEFAGPSDDEQAGRAERVVDPSGVVVVRGRTVELGKFAGAGPSKNIGLTDLVTGRDGSPMTAGIMSWRREDSFPWTLGYDEVDLVLEGILHITVDGRVVEGRAGDVLYLPKNSRIIFGTPTRVRVFYVTYPADWAAAASAPTRPNKE